MTFPQTRCECLNKSREFKILLRGYETYKKFRGDSETNLLTNGDISKEWCKLTPAPCPFLRDSARFVTIIIHCPESGAEWDMCARVLWTTNATTVRTDRLQYVRMNTSQRTLQTTVHYCLITICLWDRGFKPGSDPAGDSCPTWFHSAVRCLQQQWKVFSISDTKRL